MTINEHWFREVMEGASPAFTPLPGLLPATLRTLAAIAAPVYSAVITLRNYAYAAGLFKTHNLGRRTISIGNLSTGGTGKTPVAALLAAALVAAGEKPVILMRGYRARPGQKGDEQLELESALNGQVPVIANPDRVAAARAALAAFPDTTIFLLDDGFQHRRVHRDLDIVLVSAQQGLTHTLPRGFLREPAASLARAHVLILTRIDQAPPARLAELTRILRRENSSAPLLHCTHAFSNLRQLGTSTLPTDHLHTLPLHAFTGTGDPSAFIHTLKHAGLTLTGHRYFPDHHPYTPADLTTLATSARSSNAAALITTAKDAVKLTPDLLASAALPVLCLSIKAALQGDQLTTLVALARRPTAPAAPTTAAPPAPR